MKTITERLNDITEIVDAAREIENPCIRCGVSAEMKRICDQTSCRTRDAYQKLCIALTEGGRD